jgi:hypothetical protein
MPLPFQRIGDGFGDLAFIAAPRDEIEVFARLRKYACAEKEDFTDVMNASVRALPSVERREAN